MATGKITQTGIERLLRKASEANAPAILWDDKLAGFGARAAPNGRLSWVFQHYIGKHQKRITFAHYPPTKEEDARKQAEALRADVNKGVDVLDRKQRQRKAKIAALEAAKLGETVDLYLRRHTKPGSYWVEVKRKFDREIVPTLGKDTLVATITKAEVRSLIDAKLDAGHDGAARYLFAVLRPFFKWCVGRDLVAVSPLSDLPPPAPLEARDRLLSDAEIKTFWQATAQMGDLWQPFYRLLLLTAQRREEVAGIRWPEIDLEASTWTIPAERTKNGKEHTVHLSPQAVATIAGVKRLDGTEYLFTTTLDTAVSGYGKAKARLDGFMRPKTPWVVHDLRRTAASGMAKLSFQPHIVERVLNHISGAQGGLVAVYQRYEYLEERKKALFAWGNYVENLVSEGTKQSNILHFRG